MKKILLVFLIFCVLVLCEGYFDQLLKIEFLFEIFYIFYDVVLCNVVILYVNVGYVNDGIMISDWFMMFLLMNEGLFDLILILGSVLNLWLKYYVYIVQVNLIFERLEINKEVIDENVGYFVLDKVMIIGLVIEMLMGEVCFFWVYVYFILYCYYGGVFLIIEFIGLKLDYVL